MLPSCRLRCRIGGIWRSVVTKVGVSSKAMPKADAEVTSAAEPTDNESWSLKLWSINLLGSVLVPVRFCRSSYRGRRKKGLWRSRAQQRRSLKIQQYGRRQTRVHVATMMSAYATAESVAPTRPQTTRPCLIRSASVRIVWPS